MSIRQFHQAVNASDHEAGRLFRALRGLGVEELRGAGRDWNPWPEA